MVVQEDSVQGPGAQTYKLEQLAELIAQNEQDIEFSDLDSAGSSGDEDTMEENDSVSGVSGLRGQKDRSLEIQKRMSVGGLAPGIKVRQAADIMKEFDQRDIVNYQRETADPLIYSVHGGFYKQMKDMLNKFMRNEPEVNVMLSALLMRISSFPVKVDTLDGQFTSTTQPFDKTHANLTLLHMFLFDQPLAREDIDLFSIQGSLVTVHAIVDEYLQDENLAALVQLARKDGQIRDLTIPSVQNAWLKSSLRLNKQQIFNSLIFKELLKSLTACLGAKEVISDMIGAYEQACAEDIALEAAMTVFSKKKQLNYVERTTSERHVSQRGSRNATSATSVAGDDMFG